PDERVRLAAVVAAGNIPRPESIDVVLQAAEQPIDSFIELALRASVSVLRPYWAPVVAQGAPGWKPAWRTRLQELDRPRPPPPARAVARTRGEPVVSIQGRLQA